MEGPMKNLFDPAGKVALVTGGTSGLGHAIAEAFLQNGVDVAVCSRHPESAPELAELAAAEGRRYLPVYCDITKEEDVEKMGDIIEKELGPVTMLVNSAGMNILKHAEDYDAESFNKVMSLNVLGTHNVSKMCGKRWMIPAHKGRIVNLSSAKAFLGTDRDYTAYCASKGAINMYTAQLACEWAKFGISVNAIAPTFVVTPSTPTACPTPYSTTRWSSASLTDVWAPAKIWPPQSSSSAARAPSLSLVLPSKWMAA